MQKRGAEAPAMRGITSSGLLAESTFLALLRSASSLSSNYVYHLLDSVIRHAFDSLYPPPAALISAPRGEGSGSVLRVGISKQSRPAPESSAPEACGTVQICDLGNSSHARAARESKLKAPLERLQLTAPKTASAGKTNPPIVIRPSGMYGGAE